MIDNEKGVTAGSGVTKAKIERAALLLFAARGIDAVTTREIALASGVSEGALYRHYPGKEKLAEAMFLTIHTKLAGEVRTSGQSSSHINQQADAVVSAYCRIADEDWPLFSYHLLTTHRFLPKITRDYNAGDSPVAAAEDIIEAAMRRKEIPAGDSNLKAAMALGVVLQAAYHKMYGRINVALSHHQTDLTKAVIAVLYS